jgi:hypothetical protein
LNSYAYVEDNPLKYVDTIGLAPVDPVERHILGHAIRGNWREVISTIRTLGNFTEKEIAKLARNCANKRGGELVKQIKREGVGTGARSGQHGVPFKKAGNQLIQEANDIAPGPVRDALKTVGQQLIKKGNSISHR